MSKCKKNLHFSVKSRSKPDFHTLIARKMTYIKNKKKQRKALQKFVGIFELPNLVDNCINQTW